MSFAFTALVTAMFEKHHKMSEKEQKGCIKCSNDFSSATEINLKATGFKCLSACFEFDS